VAPPRIDPFGSAPIIATDDTELRRVPTIGSVVEMKSVRLIIRATVVAIALLGGVATTAFADTDTQTPDPATIPDPQTAVTAAETAAVTAADGAAQLDPSDPGLPPD
jgi:hypothetical protein